MRRATPSRSAEACLISVTCSIPAALGGLAELRTLELQNNALTGETPSALTNLRQLDRFDASGNAVCVPSDAAFRAWREAIEARGTFRASSCDDHAGDRETLAAFYDATGGPEWTVSTNWKSDEPLYAWHGVVTDADGRVAGISLPENNLTGPVPLVLESLAHLSRLQLGGNRFSGSIPVELGNLANLEELSLWNRDDYLASDDEGLSGAIPADLGNLTNLTRLNLGGNNLTGPIPAAVGNLTTLQELNLGRNGLTGDVPAELGSLTNLRRLHLRGNRLTGATHADLGRLTDLRWLDLGSNDLTAGPIPAWVGNLTSLEGLSLSRASVTGPVPLWLENLTNLRRLDLSYNWELAGPLPPNLDLSHLERLDVFGTRACAPDAWLPWVEAIDFAGAICGSQSDVIDVAVFYVPPRNPQSNMEALIDLFIAETNRAFEESGVRTRVALVAREEVDYPQTGDDRDVIMEHLSNPSDGYLDGVHAVRERVGADLVHLIVRELDVCGAANLGGPFGTTRSGCGSSTFGHELGHNLGLQHDRWELLRRGSKGEGLSLYPGHGLVRRDWRTVMAYSTGCGNPCTSLFRYSNPRQTWQGEPMGVPADTDSTDVDGPADAAAVLDATGPVVATWRSPPGANRPPTAVGTLPDRTLTLDDTLDLDPSPAFVDPDGDTLTYAVSTSEPQVVTVLAAGAWMTLTAVGRGSATIRVTAADTGGLSATQSFTVTVAKGANRPPGAVGALPDRILQLPEHARRGRVAGVRRPRPRRADLRSVDVGAAGGGGTRDGQPRDPHRGRLGRGNDPGNRERPRGSEHRSVLHGDRGPDGAVHRRPDPPRGDAGQGHPLHRVAHADRRGARGGGARAVCLDGSGSDRGGDASQARAPARAAGGRRRGVRGDGPAVAALDGRVACGGVDPDPGGAPDGASRRSAGAGVRRASISAPAIHAPARRLAAVKLQPFRKPPRPRGRRGVPSAWRSSWVG